MIDIEALRQVDVTALSNAPLVSSNDDDDPESEDVIVKLVGKVKSPTVVHLKLKLTSLPSLEKGNVEM